VDSRKGNGDGRRIFCGLARRGHVGAGRGEEFTVYLRAQDICAAMGRYSSLPGLKKPRSFISLRIIEGDELAKLKDGSTGKFSKFLSDSSVEYYYSFETGKI
jgi:hypothetical protein|tara:strand:- start:247 stop:552 length:306 start_codon:yes stop_codon:yes gene_type:complete